jgi:hypothetical protein
MVERHARVAAGHRREAVEALARGERLQRSGPRSGTGENGAIREAALAGVS